MSEDITYNGSISLPPPTSTSVIHRLRHHVCPPHLSPVYIGKILEENYQKNENKKVERSKDIPSPSTRSLSSPAPTSPIYCLCPTPTRSFSSFISYLNWREIGTKQLDK